MNKPLVNNAKHLSPLCDRFLFPPLMILLSLLSLSLSLSLLSPTKILAIYCSRFAFFSKELQTHHHHDGSTRRACSHSSFSSRLPIRHKDMRTRKQSESKDYSFAHSSSGQTMERKNSDGKKTGENREKKKKQKTVRGKKWTAKRELKICALGLKDRESGFDNIFPPVVLFTWTGIHSCRRAVKGKRIGG